MKKIIIFSLLNIVFLSVFSQNFDILKDDQTTVVTNDTVTISSTKVNSDFSEIFYYRNNTSNNEDVKVLFEKIDLVSHATYAYCWDQCYSNPDDGHISGVVTVNAASISTIQLNADYTPAGNYGTSIFKYSFICDALQDTTSFFVKFKITQTSAIEDYNEEQKVLIYPNPCNDFFSLKNLSENKIASIHLFNILGNEVKIKSNGQKILYDTKKLANGLYLLKINYVNHQQEIYRVIVNH